MRVTTVNKAQKDQGTCRRCNKPVVKGESYRWAKGRYSARRVIHADCGHFRSSELTDNDKLSTLYAAQEDAAEAIDAIDAPATFDDCDTFVEEVKQVLSDCGDAADEAREMYEESASNIEDGFGHETFASEEQREGAEEVETWQSDLQDADFTEPPTEDETPDAEPVDVNDVLESWASEVRSEAHDIIDGLNL